MSIDVAWISARFPHLSSLSLLGKGGQKRVWAASDKEHGDVVFKLIFPTVDRNRIDRELLAVTRIASDRVPSVYKTGLVDTPEGECVWLVEQRVVGDSVRSVLQGEGAFSKAEILRLGLHCLYMSTALEEPTAEYRVAAVLPLLTGIASGELRHLRPCDVDFDAGIIHVRGAEDRTEADWDVKTANRSRRLELPEDCRSDLEELCRGLAPEAYIFSMQRRARQGEPRTAEWLHAVVKRVCLRAEVRVVAPHGLRDTHSSLRREVLGEGSAQIAAALGHGDSGQTAERHYIGATKKEPTLRVLEGGRNSPPHPALSAGGGNEAS